MNKRILSLFICFVMFVTLLPIQAFATTNTSESINIKSPTTDKKVTTFDCVWFGNYYQSNDQQTEPIKWRVLSVEDNTALLIADKNLDNKTHNSTSWNSSSVKKWLNEDFKKAAFNSLDQEAIDAENGIFVLSNSEKTNLKFENDSWISSNTEFLKNKLEEKGLDPSNTEWWLRDQYFNVLMYSVDSMGYTSCQNYNADNVMVRPCVYLDLTKKSVWQYAGTVSSDGKVNEIKYTQNGEYFSGKKDGWPISNSLYGLGYEDKHFNFSIITYFSKLLTGVNSPVDIATNTKTTIQWLNDNINFGGNCFGMSLSSAGIYSGKYDSSRLFPSIDVTSKTLNQYGYDSIGEKTYNVDNDTYTEQYYTLGKNNVVSEFIEGLHLIQQNFEFKNKYRAFKGEKFDSLIEYMRDCEDDRVILACFDIAIPDGLPAGHAVIIDKSELPLSNGKINFVADKDGNYKIPLYDPNYPDDSTGVLKNPIEDYKCNSYLVVNPEKDIYTYRIENSDGTLNTEYAFLPRCEIEGIDMFDKIKFYDVSNVDEKFFGESAIKDSLKNILFIGAPTWRVVSSDGVENAIEVVDGVISKYDSNIIDFTKFVGNFKENNLCMIQMKDYNNKIIIKDGSYFIMGENNFCGLSVEGEAETELNVEDSEIIVKALNKECNVELNIQDELSSDYKTVNIKVDLNNEEEIVVQNNNGVLKIDAPAQIVADIETDDAGTVEKEENAVLEKVNDHIIGEEKLENSVEHICQWSSGKVTKEANCEESGTIVKNCLICDAQHSENIAKLGHNYSSTYTIDKQSTSSTNGSKSKHCTRTGCDAKTAVTIIPKISSVSLSNKKYTYNGYNKTPSVAVKDSKGNILKKGTDYSVSYASKRWDVGRYKVTVTFKGNYSGTKALYYTIVPKATTNTKANLYGYDDVKVTWSKARGASGYFVYYKKSSSSKYTYYGRTTKNSMKIANFTDGIKYNFKVVPYYYSSSNKTRYSSLQSTVASVYTLKKVSTPTITKNGTKVKVKWSNINGETGYQISRSTKKTGTNIVSTYKTSSDIYKNISASKGKTYYYKVRAYKVVDGKKICGPWSKVKSYKRR